MRDDPHTEQLLEAVLDHLKTEVLEAVPRESRTALLMCNRAIGIAIARLHTGRQELQREGERLRLLLGIDRDNQPIDEALAGGYNQQLVAMIRKGAFDAPGEPRNALHRHLVETLSANIRETNPRMLSEDVET